ncbi:MAG: Crp/Fnr family transcriptional regulator [Clostridia bacterium]|nr:Crp/Fnr family transcriptional regulator [Clostridia bacterium]
MNYSFLSNTMLFRGASADEIVSMLHCLGAYERPFQKGEQVLRAGDCVESMGLVLTGSVNIEIDDLWGNKTILGRAESGQLFAETYACIPGEPLMVSVVAAEKSLILFMKVSKLITTCQSSCAHHNRLIQNLLQISAQKNLSLSRRSLHTSQKTIRGRLLSYLSEQAKQAGSYSFTVPFNRQQLADYLGVDRSALSNELSKMQRDGILTCNKSNFTLKNSADNP